MNNKKNEHVVAEAIRVEFNSKTDDLYLVFKVTDKEFKKRMKDNWMEDVSLHIDGKELILEK